MLTQPKFVKQIAASGYMNVKNLIEISPSEGQW